MECSVLTMVMAGGRGERLAPLTQDRAKPAVPFAGALRIIDFTLSNCVNSGLFQVCLLTQYKSLSLDRHVDLAWKPFFQRELRQRIEVIPPQQRVIDDWYRGTADAVYQNLYSIDQTKPKDVLILAGDHIYSMDYRKMIEFHRDKDADVTIGAIRVPLAEARNQLGVLQVDEFQRVTGFQEKPQQPIAVPGNPNVAYASMGIYLFKKDFLIAVLQENAANKTSGHDFGNHILPMLFDRSRVLAYPFQSDKGMNAYWRDVGTLDSYFEASMEVLNPKSQLQLDNACWPIHSCRPNLTPTRFRTGATGFCDTQLRSSIVSCGSHIESALVASSILGYSCTVGAGSRIEESVLFGNTQLGRDVRLKRVIVDKNCSIADGMRIGFDPVADKEAGCTVTKGGITVLPRGYGATGSVPMHHLKSRKENAVREQARV